MRCTRVTWQFADEETECANFLKRCDARPRPLVANVGCGPGMDEGHDPLFSGLKFQLVIVLGVAAIALIIFVAAGVGDGWWIQNRKAV